MENLGLEAQRLPKLTKISPRSAKNYRKSCLGGPETTKINENLAQERPGARKLPKILLGRLQDH